MDALMVSLVIIFIIGLITQIVLKILKINWKNNITSKINLVLFVLITSLIGFYPSTNFIDSFETAALCYMTGFFCVLIYKVITDEGKMQLWIWIWSSASLLYLIASLIKYRSESFIKNMVDFGVVLLPSLLVLAVILMMKKNQFGKAILKTLGISYLFFGFLFCIMPPNDYATAVASLLMVILAGAVPGAAMFAGYKKIYSKAKEIDEMMDGI